MKTHRGSGGIPPPILNPALDRDGNCFTPQPVYFPSKCVWYPQNKAGWAIELVWTLWRMSFVSLPCQESNQYSADHQPGCPITLFFSPTVTRGKESFRYKMLILRSTRKANYPKPFSISPRRKEMEGQFK